MLKSFLRAARGAVALGAMGVLFSLSELTLRTVVWAIIKMRPASRERVLASVARGLKRIGLPALRWTSGMRLVNPVRIPSEPGVLIIMNHQSLVDVPVVWESVTGSYPKIVTRRRYATARIPLVSYMLRLYEYPLVDPGADIEPQLAGLAEAAAAARQALVLFPEGSRTRDGEIKPFKTAGLKAVLPVRRWSVYVVVVDGLWHCAKIQDFIKNVSTVQARVESVGPFSFDGARDDTDTFIASMREKMCDKLAEMRESQAQAAKQEAS